MNKQYKLKDGVKIAELEKYGKWHHRKGDNGKWFYERSAFETPRFEISVAINDKESKLWLLLHHWDEYSYYDEVRAFPKDGAKYIQDLLDAGLLEEVE